MCGSVIQHAVTRGHAEWRGFFPPFMTDDPVSDSIGCCPIFSHLTLRVSELRFFLVKSYILNFFLVLFLTIL